MTIEVDALTVREWGRRYSNWGRWGDDDERGTQNLVDADMYLDRLQLEISIAGRQLRFDHGPPMNVLSALATDVIEQPISIDGATAAAIASATANSRSAAYALKGAAWTAEPKRRFDVEQEGFLSAVPGRPDEYR